MPDRRALKILFDTYWSPKGWKQEYAISPEDFAYARAAGLMFDPAVITHESASARIRKVVRTLDPVRVGNAFLASLSTRRLELRSALGSYAIARHFPEHGYHELSHDCFICGWQRDLFPLVDLSVLSFERHKWGGVRHEQPEYIAFDLEQFALLPPVEPTGEDLEIMRSILSFARSSAPDGHVSDLEKRMMGAFKSNQAERKILLQILGYCGILQRDDYPGYFESFVYYDDRKTRPSYWNYPVCWWRGMDGVCEKALKFYFPQL